MFKKLKPVPLSVVLVIFTICQESCLDSQFCQADPKLTHYIVNIEKLFIANRARLCTVNQSCDIGTNMTT